MSEAALGTFLFSHLAEQGVRHCFGIPGDYILPLYRQLEATEGIDAVVATHEPCAAFSADGYARQSGLGVLLLTYGVGGFNAMNGVAGAFAECSPLLVVSGGPPRGYAPDHPFRPVPHHVVRRPSDQLDAYRHITDLALRIESTAEAAATIRRAVAHTQRVKKPVYLEIPTDLEEASIPVDPAPPAPELHDPDVEHAVDIFLDRLAGARRPVLLLGVEVARYRLQSPVRQLMEGWNIPAALTVLGKGALAEVEPGVLGVYAGALSPHPEVRRRVEESDLVFMLGALVTDVGCGAFTADLRRDHLLIARTGWIGDGFMRVDPSIDFDAFVRALARRRTTQRAQTYPPGKVFNYRTSDSLVDRFFGVIETHLTHDTVVVADTGDASYGSLFLRLRRECGYVAPTFYNTMGFAVPAALGVQLADPSCRPLVLVGDGAFQMTGLEFSNMVRLGLDPVVVLLNNDGFGMQRVFQDGAFNAIGRWDYQRVPDLVGGGRAWRVTTTEELDTALGEAKAFREGPSLIEVVYPRGVISTGLQLISQALLREKTGHCPLGPAGAGPCEHAGQCGFCRAAIWR